MPKSFLNSLGMWQPNEVTMGSRTLESAESRQAGCLDRLPLEAPVFFVAKYQIMYLLKAFLGGSTVSGF